jgi:predicted HTH transcriptional regulator
MLIDLNKLLEIGEGLHCEYKSSFNKTVTQSLCAFANTKGGCVIIGVNNAGTPVGIDLGKESLQTWINEVKQNTSPTIIADAYDFNINGKTIAVLVINEFPIKPISANGKYYKRIKNSNHQMTLSEVSNMHIKTFNSSWDYYEDPNHSLDDLLLDKVNKFIEKANKYKRVKIYDDPLTVLKKYELLKKRPTESLSDPLNDKKIINTIKTEPIKQLPLVQSEPIKQPAGIKTEPLIVRDPAIIAESDPIKKYSLAYKKAKGMNLLLDFINNDPQITKDALAQYTMLSKSTIKRHLRELQEQGRLQREGSRKAGKWIVIENITQKTKP